MPTTVSFGRWCRLPLTLFALVPAHLTAEPVSIGLDYSCVFPILEEQPLTVRLDADIPSEVEVGQATEPFLIEATASVNEDSWNGLNFVGSTTVSGDVLASANIRGPGLDLDLSIPLAITEKALPETRTGFNVEASGSTPALTFSDQNVGELEITVGSIVMNLVATDANGSFTGLGPIESECQLSSGQPVLLQRITVISPDTGNETLTARGDGNWEIPETGTAVSLDASLTAATGGQPAETSLTLANTSTAIPIISLFNTLSLNTDIHFESAGDASVSINGNTLTAEAPVHIELAKAELRLFGLRLSDGGGENCRTGQPATLSVSTVDGAWSTEGQPFSLNGTLDIPEFRDCGNVTRLVNRYLAGPDQPVELRMTPVSDISL